MALQIMPEDSLNLFHHKMEKCKNLVSVCKTFRNLLLQNYSKKILDIAHK